MIKLRVIDKNKYDYLLEDNENNKYKINIEFYDIEVNIGDYIYLNEKILDEKNIYTFGPLIEDKNIKEEDIIKIIKNNEEIYLQRYYG